ncbi:MAG: cytidylyltransferase domain-containing protein [Nevskiaceae bacterium]
MSVAVIVQARMSSRRLPGKVLLPLAGAPALARMMERVARVRGADYRLVATSDRRDDDAIARAGEAYGFEVRRGPLDDVLARFDRAVPRGCDVVVRLTADCPLVDPALVDRHIARFRRARPRAEYVSNAVVRTQPDGLDVEVVARAWLRRAARGARDPYDREHVLPWVRRRARLLPVTQETDLSALRWTLDTRGDYRVIRAIYAALYERNPRFGSADVYRLLLRRPELIRASGARLGARERRDWQRRIARHLERERS